MEFNADQMKKDALAPEGIHKFKVNDASEKTSQAGNDMINLRLELYIDDKKVNMTDRLILIPKMFWKIEHFCNATGKGDLIDKGRLTAGDCMFLEGYAVVAHKYNDISMQTEAIIKDYVIPENVPTPQPNSTFDDQDLPF